MSASRSARDRAPALVGHRGAAALEPENTLRSFRRAAGLEVAQLECDVHLSADGADVVIHDATVDRTAQADSRRRTGAVASLTRAQLDEVQVGEGEPIPSLSQVLDACVRPDGTRIPLLVEVKAVEAARTVVRILADRFDAEEFADPAAAPAHVISFHAEALRTARELAPAIPRLLTCTQTTPEFWALAEELEVGAVGVRIADARTAEVQRARALGAQLNLWTARSEDELRRALELGCDTITVDDPVWAAAEVARAEAAVTGAAARA